MYPMKNSFSQPLTLRSTVPQQQPQPQQVVQDPKYVGYSQQPPMDEMQQHQRYQEQVRQAQNNSSMGRGMPGEQQQRYLIQEKIGSGTYGVVYKAFDQHTGQIVAIKRIAIDSGDDGIPCTALREVSLLKSLDHPNIVKLLDVNYRLDDEESGHHSSGTSASLDLIFEFCEYDLRQYCRKMGGQLGAEMIRSIMKQICSGTEYCHAAGVMHRDIKPQNILIDKTGTVKLIDFGLARAFCTPLKPYTHEVVTLWYRAPEVLLGDKLYSPSIDMWSIGVIFAEISEGGRAILNGDSEIDQLYKTFRLVGTPSNTLWSDALKLPNFKGTFPKWQPQNLTERFINMSSDGVDLLRQMIKLDPKDRITCAETLEHPYLK